MISFHTRRSEVLGFSFSATVDVFFLSLFGCNQFPRRLSAASPRERLLSLEVNSLLSTTNGLLRQVVSVQRLLRRHRAAFVSEASELATFLSPRVGPLAEQKTGLTPTCLRRDKHHTYGCARVAMQ